MSATFRDVQAALQAKSGFEVVDHSEGENQLRVMGRQLKDRMGVNMNNWLLVVRSLLRHSRDADWKVDVSKQYFTRGEMPDEQVVYGWRLIFQGEGIKVHYKAIVQAISSAPHTSRGELTEYPLPGASANRNVSDGRRRGVNPTREVDRIPGRN